VSAGAAASAPAVVAIDVGGTGIKLALVDGSGVAREQAQLATPVADGPAAVVEAVRGAAAKLAVPQAVALGIVVPGEVDVAAGVARYSANIGWRDVPLRALLSADLGLPVVLDHDVRAAGLAERTLGRAAGVADCLLVVAGTGIAGVLIAGGATVRGATDLAGELGHIPVYPDGELCACGQRGCLETYASAAAIARRYAARTGAAPDAAQPASAADVVATRGTDPAAAAVWAEATEALGIALATYTMLLDPALIVLGGGLAAAGDALLEPVREVLAARLTWRPPPRLTLSPLGGRAGLSGAALLAWQAVGRTDFTAWTRSAAWTREVH
jgi:glucokinase